MKIITLTTDFGTKDPYVGIMKGVILSINPKAYIVDITHDIEPANIVEGAYILKETYRAFPKGTIHIGVVDPGVGGKRRPILIKTDNYIFVGPDNGLFSFIIEENRNPAIVHLSNKKYFLPSISTTFHGRDIFAPVAAYISKGTEIDKMGFYVSDPVILKHEKAIFLKDMIVGTVVRKDRFGNLITNISEQDIIKKFGNKEGLEVKIADMKLLGISNTYSDVEKGKLLALIGSSGFLEISANMANAYEMLGNKSMGLKVQIRKRN